jgi:hypothetical protein
MPWDETAFQARIMAAAGPGVTDRDVMRKAQAFRPTLSLDTFGKPPGTDGRSYNVIEAIAAAVGLTVGEAIGAHCPPSMPLLELAIETALRAIRSDRPELLPDAIAWGYDVFAAHQREGTPIDSSVISTVEKMVRSGRRR